MSSVIIASDPSQAIDNLLAGTQADHVFLLSDATTAQCCLPLLAGSKTLSRATRIVVPPTDTHKTLETLSSVWKALSAEGSRHSLLVNLGGGMVTDLGGFAAATFKRGIPYINIPTTLLAMVDAAVGGKTAINFEGLKNEIGAFCPADHVIISTAFLRTLDAQNLRSGYAEMLKHGLISGEALWQQLLHFPLCEPDFARLQTMVADSIAVKEGIVAQDPKEQGLRKALNLGHTIGHAFESLALERDMPVLHGYAVAWGMACELYLSLREGFPAPKLHQTVAFIKEHYGRFAYTCNDYPRLISFMKHDKKNKGGVINFTLLAAPGALRLDCHATEEELCEALDFLRETN